eukprot:341206-Prymnesium_polylepis.1
MQGSEMEERTGGSAGAAGSSGHTRGASSGHTRGASPCAHAPPGVAARRGSALHRPAKLSGLESRGQALRASSQGKLSGQPRG